MGSGTMAGSDLGPEDGTTALSKSGRPCWVKGFEAPRKPQAGQVDTFQTMRYRVTQTHHWLVRSPGREAA